MKISVIIPTRDRPDSLQRTLTSLAQQEGTAFETIVVDNSASGSARAATERLCPKWPGRLFWVHQPQGGLAEARNQGVKNSHGDLLVFTDDDVTFAPGWLKAFATHFTQHAVMTAASGRVAPVWESPPPAWLLAYLDTYGAGHLALLDRGENFHLAADNELWGCNMAIRREVFSWTGFHPELYGSRTLGDGETGLASDIRTQGGLIGYIPDAQAYHHIAPHRMTVQYIKKWAWHWSGCYMFQRWHLRLPSALALVNELTRILRTFFPFWLQAPLQKRRLEPKAIHTQFMSSLGRAQLAYLWWMLTDPFLKEILARESFAP